MYHIKEFLKYLQDTGYAGDTIYNYSLILKAFFGFLQVRKIDDIRNVNEKIVLLYFDSITQQHAMISISNRKKIARITKYFAYLAESNTIFISPVRDYIPPRRIKSSYPILNDREVHKMMNSIDSPKSNSVKARAIMEVMYSSALRTREVYNLKINQIDFQKGILFIEQSKNKKDRVIPVGKKALYWLSCYLNDIRPKYAKKYHDYIFINHKTGNQLTGMGLLQCVNIALQANGYKPIKLYSLRVTAATALLKNGMSISHISELLGHSDINTTRIYLRVNENLLANELNKRHPRILNARRIGSNK